MPFRTAVGPCSQHMRGIDGWFLTFGPLDQKWADDFLSGIRQSGRHRSTEYLRKVHATLGVSC